jgi:hypothetical protein
VHYVLLGSPCNRGRYRAALDEPRNVTPRGGHDQFQVDVTSGVWLKNGALTQSVAAVTLSL